MVSQIKTWIIYALFATSITSFLGWYWIDPNLGMTDDAIYIFCNMTDGTSCVFPDVQTANLPNIPWRKESHSKQWYSKLRGGSMVSINLVNSTYVLLFQYILDHLWDCWISTNGFFEITLHRGSSKLHLYLCKLYCLVQFKYTQAWYGN